MTGDQITICRKQLLHCIFPVVTGRHAVLELEKVHWMEENAGAENSRGDGDRGRNDL